MSKDKERYAVVFDNGEVIPILHLLTLRAIDNRHIELCHLENGNFTINIFNPEDSDRPSMGLHLTKESFIAIHSAISLLCGEVFNDLEDVITDAFGDGPIDYEIINCRDAEEE